MQPVVCLSSAFSFWA